MNKETTKAIKMFLRTIIISALPVFIASLQNGVDVRPMITAVVIAILMGANTYINASPDIESRGILPLTKN